MGRERRRRSRPSTKMNHQAHPRGQFILAQVAHVEEGVLGPPMGAVCTRTRTPFDYLSDA